MARASNSIEIKRSAEDVYRFLVDGLNNPKWRPAVVDIGLASGIVGTAGAVYRQKIKGPLGSTIDGNYRLIDAKPYSHIKFEVITGPARPIGEFDVTSLPSGSRVVFSLGFEPKGLQRLMDGMIQSTMNAEVANLARLKSALEKG